MESATIDTEIEDRSRVSPPSYCDHLTPCLYRTILECNLNFTNSGYFDDLYTCRQAMSFDDIGKRSYFFVFKSNFILSYL